MRVLMLLGALALAGCGVQGEPLQPSAGLGIGIGPGGVSVRPRVSVSDGTGTVAVGAGGVSAGVAAGPVTVGASL